MFKAIKAPLVPTVILIGEIVLANEEWASEWLVGLLVGFTLFWLFASLLSSRLLLKRFPWLREWVPFLDPTGGFATEAELMNQHIEGKSFRLVDVGRDGRIEGKTFDDCIIYGPAVMACQGFTAMREPTWNSNKGDLVYEQADQKTRAGMIIVKDCTFNRCSMYDIGVVGSSREEFMKNIVVQDARSSD